MNYYENLEHGSKEFPVGVHDTVCEQGFSLYPHLHREFEFLIMKKGSGKLYIDDVEYVISEGDAIFINSEALHVGLNIDEEETVFYAIVFSPELFGSFGDDLIMNKYVMPVINKKIHFGETYSTSISWQKEVVDLLEAVHLEYINANIGYELKIKAMLMEAWQLCFANGSRQSENIIDDTVEGMKKVFAYIHEEYASQLTLEDIAARTNMSRGYFCRRFSEIMHMTPFEYLLRVRIENSCRMLLASNLPIGEIALQCGFNSFSYFSKTFRSFKGCTPGGYRKSVSNR
ncbi:MAG: helix-turn-helix transcriptional regulator [Lachnospiraceae bacterium]|nr:helix-turn-helix transcriptional regulator [Lachnospiraceae bacterium]